MYKNKLTEIISDLKIQNPDSFLGIEFYKHLDEKNVEIGRKSWILDEYLFPINKQFLNPLNPVFIDKIYDLEAIELVKFMMVRDGIYSVVDFFTRFPTPNEIKCTLVIPEIFAPFVPLAWTNNIQYYFFGITKNDISLDKNSILYLTGICSHNSYSSVQFDRLVTTINDKNIKLVRSCIDYKDDYFGAGKINVQKFELFQALYRRTGVEVEFYKWNEFDKMKQLGLIFDLNDGSEIIYDNYLVNCLLANGHLPANISKRPLTSKDYFVQLTELHGVVITGNKPVNEGSLVKEVVKMNKILANGKDIYSSDMIHYMKDLLALNEDVTKWFSIS